MATVTSQVFGRPVQAFTEPFEGTDTTFVSERLDGESLSNGRFQHCTFVNLSFKDATLNAFKFLNCVFINCYFRRTTLKNCTIIGCKFTDCDFPKIGLVACDLRYIRFHGCVPPFENMRSALPDEPNLRSDICRNLAIESSKLGLRGDARLYRTEEMVARENHLIKAVLGESDWYVKHYPGFSRVRALFRLARSRLNRYLLGYGESLFVLLRNSSIAAFAIFPFVYYIFRSGFGHQNGDSSVSLGDCILFSISTMFPIPNLSDVFTTRWDTHVIATTEAICGVIVLALSAAYVFRWSLRQ